jgi:DtxR family Mn-dependent transcriptional regulator
MGMKLKMSPSMENYLETIYDLGQDGQIARVKDVADKLNVKMSSVTGALQNLAKNEMVHYTPYQSIVLTEKGEELARRIHNRHRVITSFLTDVLGVQAEIAELDACKLEHVLSQETMHRLLNFMVNRKLINFSEKESIGCFEETKEEK